MAIALDVATTGGSTTGTTLSWSHTCTGSDRMLFVFAYDRIGATSNITGVTYNGVALTTVVPGGIQVPGDRCLTMWYLVNPASGANTVTISLTSSFIAANSVSYTGAKQTGQVDASSSGTASSATQVTGTVTTVADNCWTIMGVKSLGSTPAAGSGSTQRASANGAYVFDSNAPKTPAGSTSMVSTGGVSSDWAQIIASFSPAVSASVDTTLKTTQEYLNAKAGTVGKTQQEALQTLGSRPGATAQEAANTYAGTTGLSVQGALNVKVGTVGLTTQEAAARL